MRISKHFLKVFVAVAMGLLLVLFVLGLLIGVWLPDIVFAPRKTLAKEVLATGQSFEVIQYWNRSDFYSTELHITLPGERGKWVTLDGDDAKSWRVPMKVDEENRTVTVTLGWDRIKRVSY